MIRNLKVTLLGTGSSGGVPRVGGDWGACDPKQPRNRRRRCSILVEYWEGKETVPQEEKTIVLVDTSPDLREQLLDSGTRHIDAVLFTHDHGDQTNGMDDLRALAYRKRTQIPVFMNEFTKTALLQRFRYCFEKPDGRIHPPILDLQALIQGGEILEISGAGGKIKVEVFEVGHGNVDSLAFKFCDQLAYSPDVHTIDKQAFEVLDEVNVWVVDALRYHESPSHAHADKALQWGAQTRCKQLIFTNMHIDMDYGTLRSELPGNQVVGYDGMEIHQQF
ncbi:MAG: MBL fold metallo-hydrolase [Acidimicrobiales bacterium]|nr:MBL fold metallo-hydrolase [Hyphomonadaceae bacterium]RZV42788.1 MAG: MBL fold metallo-hydrolase [Acidimicrobiales bacterium]